VLLNKVGKAFSGASSLVLGELAFDGNSACDVAEASAGTWLWVSKRSGHAGACGIATRERDEYCGISEKGKSPSVGSITCSAPSEAHA